MNFNVAEQQKFQGSSDYSNIELSNDILKNNSLIVTAEVHVNANQALPSESLALVYESLGTDIHHHHHHHHQQQQQQQKVLNYVCSTMSSSSSSSSSYSEQLQNPCEYQHSDGNNSSNLTFSASSSHEPQAELAASSLDSESLSALSFSEIKEFIFPSPAASASSVASSFADQVTCDTINTSAAEPSESTRALQASAAVPNKNQLLTCSWTGCGKTYVLHEYLIEHEKTHDKPGKQFLCDQCGKTFSNNQELKQHKASHSDKKNFKCPLCEKLYKHKSSLAQHKKTHTTEKKFLCEFCGKNFLNQKQLERHFTSHSDKKNFKCSLCERAYKYKMNLTEHEKMHTAEKKFLCEYCDKRFSTNRQLKKHTVSHVADRDYKCSLCEKAFKTKGCLFRHKKTHVTEKKYFCDFCEKGFSSRIKLKTHSARHNTERAACSICQKNISKENLSRHMKEHADDSQIASAQENS